MKPLIVMITAPPAPLRNSLTLYLLGCQSLSTFCAVNNTVLFYSITLHLVPTNTNIIYYEPKHILFFFLYHTPQKKKKKKSKKLF